MCNVQPSFQKREKRQHYSTEQAVQARRGTREGKIPYDQQGQLFNAASLQENFDTEDQKSTYGCTSMGHADTSYPSTDMNPQDFGWKKLNGVYCPLWYDGNCMPQNIRGQQEEETEPEEDEHLSPDSMEKAKKMKDIQESEWSDSSSDEDSEPI